MFQRFQATREEREGGFTLIELLVVIIIIAILAAIAIPVFLKQREKGWKSQTESAVKNAATAAESWGTDNGGTYVGLCGGASATTCGEFDNSATAGVANRLMDNGLKMAPAVNLRVIRADATGYCLAATHDNLPDGTPRYTVYFASSSGAPSTTACT